ncbi:MAG: hypothetical protein ACLFR9_06690 [Desulfobacterales bacterium]
MAIIPSAEVRITIPYKRLALLRLLTSRGIRFEVPAGTSVKELFQQVLPVGEDYIENSIQTVFMDCRAVDDIENTLVRGPCTIAASAAMPGVFGAAFRKKGMYSGLRCEYMENPGLRETENPYEPAVVTLKLFNKVAEDLGKAVLAKGIYMDAQEFSKFWKQQQGVLEKECSRAVIDGKPAGPGQISQLLEGKNGDIRLEVLADKG